MKVTIEKIIYAKRVPFTKVQLESILRIEVDHHLRINPGQAFKELGPHVKNRDGSVTYPIIFETTIPDM